MQFKLQSWLQACLIPDREQGNTHQSVEETRQPVQSSDFPPFFLALGYHATKRGSSTLQFHKDWGLGTSKEGNSAHCTPHTAHCALCTLQTAPPCTPYTRAHRDNGRTMPHANMGITVQASLPIALIAAWNRRRTRRMCSRL